MQSLGFPIYNTLSEDTGSFSSSFPIWMPFISFHYVFALARPFNTMFNKWQSGHPSFIPNPRGKPFSFSSLVTMLAVGLSYMAFILLR